MAKMNSLLMLFSLVLLFFPSLYDHTTSFTRTISMAYIESNTQGQCC